MSILALTSNTLIGTPAAGNIEYNGQFYGTDSNASRAQMQRITQGTSVASTSGTSIDFTSLPAWVKRVTVMLNGVSTNGTSLVQAQIGAGSITSSGYIFYVAYAGGTTQTTGTTYTSGLVLDAGVSGNAATLRQGLITFVNQSSNPWAYSWNGSLNTSGSYFGLIGAGSITLSGTLDRVRITTVNGTDTFDAGSINILYEG